MKKKTKRVTKRTTITAAPVQISADDVLKLIVHAFDIFEGTIMRLMERADDLEKNREARRMAQEMTTEIRRHEREVESEDRREKREEVREKRSAERYGK